MEKNNLIQSLNALYTIDTIMTSEDWLKIINKGISDGVKWYIIDNGSGDELTVMFAETGIIIKGFDHENELNTFAYDTNNENIFSGMPNELFCLLSDEEKLSTTFCTWYLYSTEKWYQNKCSGNDGGKSWLMGYIHENADSLTEWAMEYYDADLDAGIMKKLFSGAKLSHDKILTLNPLYKQ